MVKKNRATVFYAEKNFVIFSHRNFRMLCSRHDLHLMRQHDLEEIFQEGNLYRIRHLSVRNGRRVLIPIFRHPHDVWMRKHDLFDTYEGQVISVSHGQVHDHLLVELAPNVLAFAECENFDGKKKVNFVPYKYNRKTKRIYGYLE